MISTPSFHTIIGFVLLIGLAGCHGGVAADYQRIERLLLMDGRNIETLADVGSGDGDFLPYYAGLVGDGGSVLATEIEPSLLAALEERVEREGLARVRVVQATATATGLPAGCCDAVVLRHVYHHLTEPAATLADLKRALKPGGRLLVVDFLPAALLGPWTPEDLPEDRSGHGVTPDQVVAEGEAAGFRRVSAVEDLGGGHILIERFAVLLERPEVDA